MSQESLQGFINQRLSVEDSHVSHSVVRENKKANRMIDTSGQNTCELSGSCNPDGLWEKMSRELLKSLSMTSSIVLKRKDTPRKHTVIQFRCSEPGIKGNASLLWPTPTVADSKSNGTKSQMNRETVNLSTAVKVMFSTPRASDMENPASKRMNGTDHRHQLREEVHMFPTPNASDNRDRGNLSMPSIQRRIQKGKQLNLSMVVDQTSGSLNPLWVEWLMGFPPEWTALDASEMLSYRSKSTRSSKRLQTLKEV